MGAVSVAHNALTYSLPLTTWTAGVRRGSSLRWLAEATDGDCAVISHGAHTGATHGVLAAPRDRRWRRCMRVHRHELAK